MKKEKRTFSAIIGYPDSKTGAGPFMALFFVMVLICIIARFLFF